MTANHAVYENAVTAAHAAKTAAVNAARAAQGGAYGVALSNFKGGSTTYTQYAAAVKQADQTYLASLDAAEAARQQAVDAAREALRATGEFPF